MKRLILTVVICLVLILGMAGTSFAVTLEWWSGVWTEGVAYDLIDGYKALHPDIDIKVSFLPWEGMYERFLLALRTGNAPDIMGIAVGWGPEFVQAGFLYPLDSFIAQSDVDFSDWMEGAWGTALVDGNVYSLPYRSDCYFLVYNKGMFREAGLDPERPPETWDDYLEYAKVLTEKLDGVFGSGLIAAGEPLNLTARALPYVYQNDGSILDEEMTRATINEREAVEALEWFTALYTEHGVEPRSNLENDAEMILQLFMEKRIAMMMGAQYDVPRIQANTDIDVGTALLPKNPRTGKRLVEMGGWNLVVTQQSEYPKEAYDFIEFLVQPDNMARLTDAFPARMEAFDSPYLPARFGEDIYKPAIEQLNYGMLFRYPHLHQMKTTIAEEIQSVLIGRKTVQQAMDAAAAEINDLLGN